MKFLTTLVLYCVAASATPISFVDPEDSDVADASTRLVSLDDHEDSGISKLGHLIHGVGLDDDGGFDDYDEPKFHKRDSKYNVLKKAAAYNKTQLLPDKSYYFLVCDVAKNEVEDDASLRHADVADQNVFKWVADETRTKRTPHGCFHVSLLIGTVKRVDSNAARQLGCIDCVSKTFDGTKYDMVDGFGARKWRQRNPVWQPHGNGSEQKLFFQGEIGKDVDIERLRYNILSKGVTWIQNSNNAFNMNYNCLTYYNEMVKIIVKAQKGAATLTT